MINEEIRMHLREKLIEEIDSITSSEDTLFNVFLNLLGIDDILNLYLDEFNKLLSSAQVSDLRTYLISEEDNFRVGERISASKTNEWTKYNIVLFLLARMWDKFTDKVWEEYNWYTHSKYGDSYKFKKIEAFDHIKKFLDEMRVNSIDANNKDLKKCKLQEFLSDIFETHLGVTYIMRNDIEKAKEILGPWQAEQKRKARQSEKKMLKEDDISLIAYREIVSRYLEKRNNSKYKLHRAIKDVYTEMEIKKDHNSSKHSDFDSFRHSFIDWAKNPKNIKKYPEVKELNNIKWNMNSTSDK